MSQKTYDIMFLLSTLPPKRLLRKKWFLLCLLIIISLIDDHCGNVVRIFVSAKPSSSLDSRQQKRTKPSGSGPSLPKKHLSGQQQQQQDPALSFSSSSSWRVSRTTRIAPGVRFGPFGSGGTVVGFSKYPGVRTAFEANFARRLELGAQLVIYERGEKVVDLCGAAPETIVEGGRQNSSKTRCYDGDTLQAVFSCGKNMEAIAIAMLVDRGLLSYDDPVGKHWPEFAANGGGKDRITVSDVMRHGGGVPFVAYPNNNNNSKKATTTVIPITTDDIFGVDPMERKICGAAKHPPPTQTTTTKEKEEETGCYHAMTRGFLVNGIVRRVDPSGRSLSRFLREEVTDPLSSSKNDNENEPVTFFCGIPRGEQPNHGFAPLTMGSIGYTSFGLVLPALLGFNPQLAAYMGWFLRKDGFRSFVRSVVFPSPPWVYINTPEGRSIEMSSCAMHANARSMALINAAAMAGNGSINGVRLLSKEGVERSMGDAKTATDSATGARMAFTRGGYCRFSDSFREENIKTNTLFHPDDKIAYGDFQGWGGVGGSLSLVDRKRNISFAYCTNGFGFDALWGIRTRRILLELQKALLRAEQEQEQKNDS